MKSILLQTQFTGYRPKKDKSVSLSFTSDLEVSSEQIKQFHELLDQRGIVYFSVKGELTQEEVDMINGFNIKLGGKSKSQRLRDVLYVYFEQNKDGYQSFEEYYGMEMERIIQHYKNKLED